MTNHSQFPLIGICLLLMAATCNTAAAQDAVRTEDPVLLGKWTVTENAKNGPITLVKEHANGTTTLTAFDATKRVLYAKTSQYHTEMHGKIKVFVFSNSKYTAGPDAGKTDKRTKSYVYRVDGKRFYEVRGMVDGVEESPGMVVWQRVDSPAT